MCLNEIIPNMMRFFHHAQNGELVLSISKNGLMAKGVLPTNVS
jgi:hypothetical protein